MIDLLEYTASSARLNRALNTIEGTTIITSISRNGPRAKRRYSERALKQIAAMAEGLPAYANHVAPDLAFKPRDIRDLIGRHKNGRFDATRQAVVSDLHVLEHQAPFVFGLAQGLGDVVGNSLVSRGSVRMEGDTEVVDEVAAVRSADLVSDPATTKGLFESRGATERTVAEVLVDADAHERTASAVENRAYFPPAERQLLDDLVEAVLRRQPVADVLARRAV